MRDSHAHGPRAAPRSPGNQGWGLPLAQLEAAYRLSCRPVAEWKGELEQTPDADAIRPYLVAVHKAMRYWESLDRDSAMRTISLNMTDKRL